MKDQHFITFEEIFGQETEKGKLMKPGTVERIKDELSRQNGSRREHSGAGELSKDLYTIAKKHTEGIEGHVATQRGSVINPNGNFMQTLFEQAINSDDQIQ